MCNCRYRSRVTEWRALLWVVVIGLLTIRCAADLTISLTTIGNPGNLADDTGRGAVGYTYQIGTYEITVAQYTEFLNAKAKSDPYGLYRGSMATGPLGAFITRSGTDGNYSYAAVSGKESQPVRWVSFYDGIRFCNWMHNGQGTNDTEAGSYDLSLGAYATRGPGATWVIPNENEWYKAAYYSAPGSLYYNYPHGTDTVPTEPTNGTSPRIMNFGDDPYWAPDGPWVYFTDAGETTGQSPYGTYDQGGGVEEWTETFSTPDFRVTRGGWFGAHEDQLHSSDSSAYTPGTEGDGFGLRVGFMIPEPSTVVLLALGGLGLRLMLRKKK